MAKKKINTKLIVAGAVFVVGLVMMLIVLLSPVSKIGTYKYTGEVAGQEMTQTYKFRKDKLEASMIVNDEEPITYEREFKVEDGELYMKNSLGTFSKLCDINSRKMFVDEDGEVLKNGLATTIFIVSIVLTAAGALGAGAVVVLGKKKK